MLNFHVLQVCCFLAVWDLMFGVDMSMLMQWHAVKQVSSMPSRYQFVCLSTCLRFVIAPVCSFYIISCCLIPSWAAFVSCKNDMSERGSMLCGTILTCRHFWVGTLKVWWRWIFVSLKYAVSVSSGTCFFSPDRRETLRWHWDHGFFRVKDRLSLKQLCAVSVKMSSFRLKEQLGRSNSWHLFSFNLESIAAPPGLKKLFSRFL